MIEQILQLYNSDNVELAYELAKSQGLDLCDLIEGNFSHFKWTYQMRKEFRVKRILINSNFNLNNINNNFDKDTVRNYLFSMWNKLSPNLIKKQINYEYNKHI